MFYATVISAASVGGGTEVHQCLMHSDSFLALSDPSASFLHWPGVNSAAFAISLLFLPLVAVEENPQLQNMCECLYPGSEWPERKAIF